MKFYCDQTELSKALSILSPIIPKKSSIPILGSIKISVNELGINLSGTDLSIFANVDIDGIIKTNGSALVNFVDFYNIIRGVSGCITIGLDENKLYIEANDIRFTLPVLPIEKFPSPFEPSDLKCWFEVQTKSFLNALKMVSYIPLPKDPRAFLHCLNFEMHETGLNIIATDVNRLGVIEIPVIKQAYSNALIELSAINKLTKIPNTGVLKSFISDKFAIFETNKVHYQIRLTDAQFPRWQQVIPVDFNSSFTVYRQVFLQALQRFNFLSKKIQLSIGKILQLSALLENETQTAKLDINADLTGKPFTEAFEIKFLSEFLQSVNSDIIKVEYVGPNKPIKLTALDNPSLLYLVTSIKKK